MLFQPKLNILPPAQKNIWNELNLLPPAFVLYGGTAIALRLGHRQSVDFDFFSSDSFDPEAILKSLSFLRGAEVLQLRANTLTVIQKRSGLVKLSFFGGLDFGRVGEPDQSQDSGIKIASLLDLFGHKLKTILQRIEAKDYEDIAAILKTGSPLSDGIMAALGLFGSVFPPMECIKALTYFEGSDLSALSDETKVTIELAVLKLPRSFFPYPRQANVLT